MIMADKLIALRKDKGWSQEELAEKMDVSRQAVSKWESAQAVPDLEKLLRLCEMYGVTTDYLLKENIENTDFSGYYVKRDIRAVTVEEANGYLARRRAASVQIAVGVLLLFLSPAPVILLACAPEVFGITENLGIAIGIAAFFVMLSAAFGLFTYSGFMSERYSFLKKEPFKLDDGVEGILKERRVHSEGHYIFCITVGVCICILSPLPSAVMSLFMSNKLISALMADVILLIVGVGTSLIAAGSIRRTSILRLLNGKKISLKQKMAMQLNGKAGTGDKVKVYITVAYWVIAVVIYIMLTLVTEALGITWLLLLVAGIVYAAAMIIYDNKFKRN